MTCRFAVRIELKTLLTRARRMDRKVTATPTTFPIRHTLVANLTLGNGRVSRPNQEFIVLLELASGLRWLRRKLPGLLFVLKTSGLVGTIAKWLACRVATAAKRNRFAAAKTVLLTLHIEKFDFPFDTQGSVIADRDFRRWHLYSHLPDAWPWTGRRVQRKIEARIFLLILRHPRIDFIRPRQDAALQVQ